MSANGPNTPECERYDDLLVKQATGHPLTSHEKQRVADHPQSCEACRTLAAGLETLSDPESSQDALDDLTARRLVNAALEAADAVMPTPRAEEVLEPAAEIEPTATPVERRWRWTWIGAAAVLLLVGGAIGAWALLARGGDRVPSRPTPTAALGRLLLVAGSVHLDQRAASLNDSLDPGQSIEVAEGQAAFQLASRVAIHLGASSRIRLPADARSELTVDLSKGEFVAVVGTPSARRRFSVVTPHGRVTVTGTIFGVSVRPGRTQVQVLRGRVVVSRHRGGPVILTRGQTVTMGAQHASRLTPPQAERLDRIARSLDLLGDGRSAALMVNSQPAGARVAVDGHALGATPLSAAIRPGHRRLEVSLAGYVPVSENLLLRSRVESLRDFDLKPEPPPVVTVTPPGSPPDPASTDRRHRRPDRKLVGKDGRRALLSYAQLRRAARDWPGAAAAYRRLIQRYPGTPEAGTARVSLGFIRLEHFKQPGAALASFRRYLATSRQGALGREAAYGEIKALRALGRRAAERRAVEAFLRHHPGSLHAGPLGNRLEELKKEP